MASLAPVEVPLRPYQEEAIEAALGRGTGMLLALTQGAGKTRTAIETIRAMRQEAPVSGAVFCPSTLKYQWADSEIAKWDPDAKVLVIDGAKAKRRRQYETAKDFDYVILSYETLVHDWDLLRQYLPADFLIADEVTYIKGLSSKRSKRLKALADRRQSFRLGLSGQPVENRPEELFSIMEFVDPDVLGPFHRFDRTFIMRDPWGKPRRYRNLDVLRTQLGEAMFRRSREDIAEFLPDRVEVEMPVPVEGPARKVLAHIVVDLLATLDEAAEAGFGTFNLMAHYGKAEDDQFAPLRGAIMSRITAMRLLCSHPKLLLDSAERFRECQGGTASAPSGSEYAAALAFDTDIKGKPIAELLESAPSTKLTTLLEQLDLLFEEDPAHKVVVFSSFKAMGGLLAGELVARKRGFTSINGDTPPKVRQERIVRFNEDPRCRVFISSDAGAYGVNLDRGSHLFCYDLPWSAGALGQRVARIDRTSSVHERIVISYLYGQHTIEERQFHMLQEKARIAGAFVDGKGIDHRGVLDLTLSSLREFLEKSLPLLD